MQIQIDNHHGNDLGTDCLHVIIKKKKNTLKFQLNYYLLKAGKY